MATTSPWDDSPPTVEERYETASRTSDMTVFGGFIPKDRKSGPGEVVTAAALGAGLEPSARRTGMTLLRLHSEWTAAAKPRRPTREHIEALADVLRRADERERQNRERENAELARLRAVQERALAAGQAETEEYAARAEAIALQEKLRAQAKLPAAAKSQGAPIARAYAEASRWYENELRILAHGLKSRASVIEDLAVWAAQKQIEAQAVPAGLFWWLDRTCKVCDGHAFVKIPDQPALSAKRCSDCEGTGTREIPPGARKVLVRIEYCVDQARGQLRKRLRRDR